MDGAPWAEPIWRCSIVCRCVGVYVLASAMARHTGFEFAHYPAGFIASVLFLIPGFPLIAALFDLCSSKPSLP